MAVEKSDAERAHNEYHQRLDEVNNAGEALQDAEKRLADAPLGRPGTWA